MKAMNRNEIWELLIEAEMNERYYGFVSDVCRWWNAAERLLLILAAVGSLAAVIAKSEYQLALAWLSFLGALIEVIIKPISDWEKVGIKANEWRIAWIDVRELVRDMWREVSVKQNDEVLDGEKLMKKIIAIEKAKGYVPKVQWVMDRIAQRAAKRLGS